MRIRMTFNIGSIRFSNIENASAVNFGQSVQADWDSYSKTNTGFGKITGSHNHIEDTKSRVDDPDTVDSIMAETYQTYRPRIHGEGHDR
ncbi:hypothetical protein [Ferroacidibacillus organovorans]|uniref:Uncharacterized protein n=1 Tax=Ferroacidibacillus organovorans TaxID=1765683 RepID=A0A161PWT3_9BACL|nr:hypothetical protein [Ferroacidibacillus organovorans]KYP80195.1 hypothetical protein AYJ22_02865 [Ferroacidibacillus organovorans]OAG95071.1 hypothetical protein AYW79_02340 [Ferroacidibacillus organovorans]OPG17608.1 hypothetical protein B2M26_00160 [Ferroacidibacillus organovorans]